MRAEIKATKKLIGDRFFTGRGWVSNAHWMTRPRIFTHLEVASAKAEHKALTPKMVRKVKELMDGGRLIQYHRTLWVCEGGIEQGAEWRDGVLFISKTGKRHLFLARKYVDSFGLRAVWANYDAVCTKGMGQHELYLMTMMRRDYDLEVRDLFERGLLKPQGKR